MLRLIVLRLVAAVPTVFGVATLIFVLVHLVPSDPAVTMAGEGASLERIESIRHTYGFDRPLWQQYLTYIRDLATGDFGIGYYSGRPVARDIAERLPASLELVAVAMLIATVGGISLGAVAGAYHGTLVDLMIRLVAANGLAIASFWLAILLQLVFSMWLDLLPLQGRLPATVDYPPAVTGFILIDSLLADQPHVFVAGLRHIILPAATLAFSPIASIIRFTRSGVIDNLNRDFVAMHRAFGLGRFRIVAVYVLRNSLTTVITQVGLLFSGILVGGVAVESIFGWPGLGSYLIQAVQSGDLPAVTVVTVVMSTVYILVNLLVDLVQMMIDPRIRPAAQRG